MTERDNLAGQAMSLATVLGATTCTAAAAVAHSDGEGAAAGAAGGGGSAAASVAGGPNGGLKPGPTPAQLKELGQLMQRLTKENAALMRARCVMGGAGSSGMLCVIQP